VEATDATGTITILN